MLVNMLGTTILCMRTEAISEPTSIRIPLSNLIHKSQQLPFTEEGYAARHEVISSTSSSYDRISTCLLPITTIIKLAMSRKS
jgi:hypothetical protein